MGKQDLLKGLTKESFDRILNHPYYAECMKVMNEKVDEFLSKYYKDKTIIIIKISIFANFFKEGIRLMPSLNCISKYDFKSFIDILVFLDIFSMVSFISFAVFSPITKLYSFRI